MQPRHACPHTDLDDDGDCRSCGAPYEAVLLDIDTDATIGRLLAEPIPIPPPRRANARREW